MGAFFSFIGGIKGIVVILIVAALAGWIWNQKNNLEELKLQRDTAVAQRDIVVGERDKAIAAARENDITIRRLEAEREAVNSALNTLATAVANNRENTVTREVIIQNQASVPANAARAAPVLGAIVSAIQADRVRRRGQ
jgi:hypothetical protein